MRAALVIMAAGLGRRFGGGKQVSAVGPNGEMLMEYSAYDAIAAGFDKIVFILREDSVEYVKDCCGGALSQRASVAYAVQDFSSLPAWYAVPADRDRPFGTVHAVLCARSVIDEPFCVLNADDYYGRETLEKMYAILRSLPSQGEAAMVAYRLGETLCESGLVSRGLCQIENGWLQGIRESKNIGLREGKVMECALGRELDPNALISMNIWGFAPSAFDCMERYFERFLRSLSPQDTASECLLPVFVGDMIQQDALRVRAEATNAGWFGMTYREDRALVQAKLRALHQRGEYPASLRQK